MIYLEQYIGALKFRERFDKQYRKLSIDYGALQKQLELLSRDSQNKVYRLTISLLEGMSIRLIQSIGSDKLINKCHAISHSLMLNYYKLPSPIKPEINITIGNVFYNEKNLYNLSKSTLKRIIAEGPNTNKALDVHVWLTMENMTVIDPTIMRTLVHRDEISLKSYEDEPVLFWKEDKDSHFRYEPMLVDNGFFYKVDKE